MTDLLNLHKVKILNSVADSLSGATLVAWYARCETCGWSFHAQWATPGSDGHQRGVAESRRDTHIRNEWKRNIR